MSDNARKRDERLSKTGAVPRIEFENRDKRHRTEKPAPPASIPEFPEEGSSTGVIYIVSEDSDQSAKGDEDSPAGTK